MKICYFPLTLALLVAACAQIAAHTEIVKSDGINSDLHQTNVGRIVFVAKPGDAEVRESEFVADTNQQVS